MAGKTNQKQNVEPLPQSSMGAADVLQLFIEQLNAAISDNDAAMARLVDHYGKISTDIDRLQQSAPDDSERQQIQQRLTQQLSHVAMDFQQHDNFNQRLAHVMTAMGAARTLLDEAPCGVDAEGWQQLSDRLSASYTTAEEHEVHSRLTNTAPPTGGNDIEMF